MTVIPIGMRCVGAYELQRTGDRKEAYPFDWVFCSLDVVQHCIETNFSHFLDESLYKVYMHPNHGARTHHLLYDAMNLNDAMIHHHHVHADKGDVFCTFVHQNMLDGPTHDAFKRRTQRFMTALEVASEAAPVTLLHVLEHIEKETYVPKLRDFQAFLKTISPFVHLKVGWFTPPDVVSYFEF